MYRNPSHQMEIIPLALIASCALWGLPRCRTNTWPALTVWQTQFPQPFELDTVCLNSLITLFISPLLLFWGFLCGQSGWFLLALAFPQNSCLSAAADGVVVHEQIDKLSSACVKTAHLRHEGLLFGVVRALSKRSLRLSSVVMEWLPPPEQTDWIPPDLSAHYIGSAAIFFFLFFLDANRKAPFEEGYNCAPVECSVWSAEPQFSFFCFAGRFPFITLSAGAIGTALRRAGGSVLARVVCGDGEPRRRNSSVSGMKSLWHFALSQRRMRVEIEWIAPNPVWPACKVCNTAKSHALSTPP